MADYASRRLIRLTLCHSALRRAMALLCVVAVLAVGFAHNLHHFDTALPATAWQSGGSLPDAAPESSKKDPLAVEHCHGCIMIAVIANAEWGAPVRIAAELPFAKTDGLRPHPPAAKSPPPRSEI